MRLGPPSLDDATRRRVADRPVPAGVGGKPQGREVGIESLRKHEIEIGLDVGRAGEARIVAKDPELGAVGNHAPQRLSFGVQVLLHKAVRSQPAAVATEARIRPVQVEVMRHQK